MSRVVALHIIERTSRPGSPVPGRSAIVGGPEVSSTVVASRATG